MEYKILFIKNKLKKDIKLSTFKKGLDYFEEKTPIKLVCDEISVHIPLNYEDFKLFGNKTYNGCAIEYPEKHFGKLFNPNKYHAVILIDGNDAPTTRVSVSYNNLINNSVFIYLAKTSDKGMTLNHELFHSFFTRLRQQGVFLNDPMDTYLNDSSLKSDYSNRTISLELLRPYWDKVCSMVNSAPNTVPPSKLLNFDKAVEVILKWEGGYVNDMNDPGGETKYGISKRAYPNEDIKNLTLDRAKAIYKRNYWDRLKCDSMEYPIALSVFDMAVNAGVSASAKVLQNLLAVNPDGIIGNITLSALKTKANVVNEFTRDRIIYYASLANWSKYKKGWTNRILDIYKNSL